MKCRTGDDLISLIITTCLLNSVIYVIAWKGVCYKGAASFYIGELYIHEFTLSHILKIWHLDSLTKIRNVA